MDISRSTSKSFTSSSNNLNLSSGASTRENKNQTLIAQAAPAAAAAPDASTSTSTETAKKHSFYLEGSPLVGQEIVVPTSVSENIAVPFTRRSNAARLGAEYRFLELELGKNVRFSIKAGAALSLDLTSMKSTDAPEASPVTTNDQLEQTGFNLGAQAGPALGFYNKKGTGFTVYGRYGFTPQLSQFQNPNFTALLQQTSTQAGVPLAAPQQGLTFGGAFEFRKSAALYCETTQALDAGDFRTVTQSPTDRNVACGLRLYDEAVKHVMDGATGNQDLLAVDTAMQKALEKSKQERAAVLAKINDKLPQVRAKAGAEASPTALSQAAADQKSPASDIYLYGLNISPNTRAASELALPKDKAARFLTGARLTPENTKDLSLAELTTLAEALTAALEANKAGDGQGTPVDFTALVKSLNNEKDLLQKAQPINAATKPDAATYVKSLLNAHGAKLSPDHKDLLETAIKDPAFNTPSVPADINPAFVASHGDPVQLTAAVNDLFAHAEGSIGDDLKQTKDQLAAKNRNFDNFLLILQEARGLADEDIGTIRDAFADDSVTPEEKTQLLSLLKGATKVEEKVTTLEKTILQLSSLDKPPMWFGFALGLKKNEAAVKLATNNSATLLGKDTKKAFKIALEITRPYALASNTPLNRATHIITTLSFLKYVKQMAALKIQYPGVKVILEARSDTVGPNLPNEILSRERAKRFIELIAPVTGIAEQNFIIRSYGEDLYDHGGDERNKTDGIAADGDYSNTSLQADDKPFTLGVIMDDQLSKRYEVIRSVITRDLPFISSKISPIVDGKTYADYDFIATPADRVEGIINRRMDDEDAIKRLWKTSKTVLSDKAGASDAIRSVDQTKLDQAIAAETTEFNAWLDGEGIALKPATASTYGKERAFIVYKLKRVVDDLKSEVVDITKPAGFLESKPKDAAPPNDGGAKGAASEDPL